MGTVSVRLPDDLEAELEAYIEAEDLDRDSAVRKLLAEGLDSWRRERALEQLQAGEVTFSRAAELANLNVWAFANLVRDRGVSWIDEEAGPPISPRFKKRFTAHRQRVTVDSPRCRIDSTERHSNL